MSYDTACSQTSDINEHVPTLRMYARECEHVTELGVRSCVSTWGFIKGLSENGRPKKILRSIDIAWDPAIDAIKSCHDQYTFIQENDLECTPEPTDLTFIDTWHVYAQLKRELALYAPITKKYIIMHDTEIDAHDGESIRCGLDIRRQSIESGFPEDEIRQGLQRAIDEFLSWNDDWVIDRVWKNNNGLTVLRRQRPVFLVTSVIQLPTTSDPWQTSVYTPTKRYEQTIETIESIRSKVPHAYIVILEGSTPKILFENTDETFHCPVTTLNKSVGEATLLKHFLDNGQHIVDRASIIFKISGRYTLADTFDIRKYSRTKISIKCSYVDWSRNDDRSVCHTMLFAFPPACRDIMYERLTVVQTRGPDIEHSIVYGYSDFKNISVLGIQGYLAPTGEYINR